MRTLGFPGNYKGEQPEQRCMMCNSLSVGIHSVIATAFPSGTEFREFLAELACIQHSTLPFVHEQLYQ